MSATPDAERAGAFLLAVHEWLRQRECLVQIAAENARSQVKLEQVREILKAPAPQA